MGRAVPVRNQGCIPAVASDARPLRDALHLVGGREADVAAAALPVGREEAAGGGGPPLAGADAHERGGQRRRGRRRRKALLERSVVVQSLFGYYRIAPRIIL